MRIKLVNVEGEEVFDELAVDAGVSKMDLNRVLDQLLGSPDEKQVYQFFLEESTAAEGGGEVRTTLGDVLDKAEAAWAKAATAAKKAAVPLFTGETVVKLRYRPEAMFRIRPITRASSTLEGHSEAVLSVAFSADGKQLASGSGDTTVRVWDLTTETPLHTCNGHKHWVLFVAFSPDCTKIASGGMDHNILLWNAETGEQLGKPLKGHKNFITSIAWEPMMYRYESRKMASSSKDQCVRVWDTMN